MAHSQNGIDFPTLRIVDHPLVRHKITLLRDRATSTKQFKELVDEIAMLMAYEATRDLLLEPTTVDTPLEPTSGWTVRGKKLTLVPILRAGLGMVEGILRLIPSARVGHIGLYRDHDTLEPVDYYFKVPGDVSERDFLLLDPMLATGGSAAAAVSSLKRAGATRIRFLCLVAAPEGVHRLAAAHPDVPVLTASLDRELNEFGYILPSAVCGSTFSGSTTHPAPHQIRRYVNHSRGCRFCCSATCSTHPCAVGSVTSCATRLNHCSAWASSPTRRHSSPTR
jgi:uracil phosphoribosyltransferase